VSAKIITFEKLHAYDILDRNVREQDIWLSNQNWEEAVKGWKECGPAYTLVIDNQIICCGGIVLIGNRNGEAWTLLSPLFYKYIKTAFKAIKQYLQQIVEKESLKRVQATIHPDQDTAIRFIEHLGFHNETPNGMIASGPNGENLLLFARRC
jgi:RimJ/RimL family protein N-acetyltransferase